jgi:hypothetical protein
MTEGTPAQYLRNLGERLVADPLSLDYGDRDALNVIAEKIESTKAPTEFQSIVARCITEIERNNLDEHGWVRLSTDQKKVYDTLVDWLFDKNRS